MAKDLPYFKFYSSEWNDGDITLEDFATQGVFINVCSYYWSRECHLEKSKLYKRFRDCHTELDLLIESGVMSDLRGFIKVKFLDKQWTERENKKATMKANGLKGGRPKKNQKLSDEETKSFSKKNQTITNKEEKREEEKRKEKNIEEEEILKHLNEKTGKNFRSAKGLKARLSEGFTIEDAKKVIDIKCAQWLHDSEMNQYLRPQTLFSEKFDSYLNEGVKPTKSANPFANGMN